MFTVREDYEGEDWGVVAVFFSEEEAVRCAEERYDSVLETWSNPNDWRGYSVLVEGPTV